MIRTKKAAAKRLASVLSAHNWDGVPGAIPRCYQNVGVSDGTIQKRHILQRKYKQFPCVHCFQIFESLEMLRQHLRAKIHTLSPD